ncbi:MAG: 16S rRNA (guanine(527)-N(7))-methyltransferase RsmG [Thermoanaerobaculia bacterium]
MPFALPEISREAFATALRRLSPAPLDDQAVEALYAHYEELGRWNQRLSLIGPGTAEEILSRHYGESLAALPLVPKGARRGVDVGSGAGFPGLVLAAARPEMEMTLVEARARKWSFLLAAARKASLPCRCLDARVSVPLPAGLPETIDLVTARALKLDRHVLGAFAGRLADEGRILLWVGEQDPELPPDLEPAGESRLEGSERRRILVLRRVAPPGPEAE